MPEFTGIFAKPFPEQVAAWRLRLQELRPTSTWTDVGPEFHNQGFMVAGAMKADLLADLAAAVDKAIVQGRSLEEFRKDFRAAVARHGWHGWAGEGSVKGEAWRTRVIYRTNMATTYAAGRRAQLVEGKFAFWVYRHGGSREPRPLHLSWNGLALPPQHPFWQTHSPPNGWGCSCYVAGARSAAGIRRVGGDPDKLLPPGWDSTDPKTGAPPGIDKGWGHAPGSGLSNLITSMTTKLPELPAPLAADQADAWPRQIFEGLSEGFAEFLDRTTADYERGQLMIIGAMKPAWVAAAAQYGVPTFSAEIAVGRQNIVHTFRQSKEAHLDRDWYRALPLHLRNPSAVILDTTRPGAPALLLFFGQGAGTPKLVLQLNYHIKKTGRFNVVETGKIVDTVGQPLGDGWRLIEGTWQ